MAKTGQNSVLIHSNSASKLAAPSEVSGKAGMGSMLVAGWSPCSKARSGKKVTSHKSAGTVAHLPPLVSKKTGFGSSVPDHLLGCSGPGDCGHSAPHEVLHRCVWVRSPTPLVSGDCDLDIDATDSSARHSLYDDIRSPPTPCVSLETSSVPAKNMLMDDSLVELKVSQDDLEALDNDTVSDKFLETSHEMSQLKKKLQSKKKQVQKAQKTTKVEQLHSQIVATDEQLAHLWQQTKSMKSSDKEGSQPTASSTPLASGNLQQQWLQQGEQDVADAFLDQLDETPAKDRETPALQSKRQSKASKKRKNNQPWFQLPEQKRQFLDISEASSDHSSDETLD